MSIIKSILKNSMLLFAFFILLVTLGINSSCASNKIKVQPVNKPAPEIGFIVNNLPYDFIYADGIYNNGKGLHKFEQIYNEPIQWDSFALDFDFFTSVKREQWPIMMGTSTRSIGFLLKDNMTIEITANNQKQIFQTRGIYELNRWYHAKIVKFNNNTEIYLNGIKIGEFQILIDEDAKSYFSNNISSVNYSNGIAFDGSLRNIIYLKNGDFEISESAYKKYSSKYKNENVLLSKTANIFKNTNEYQLFGLNWESFRVQFDYYHTDDYTKLIIGDKWKIMDFHTINDTASISINNNRISFLSGLKLEPKQKYKVEILVNNNQLQMLIDDKVILNTKFEYYYKTILERENIIFAVSKKDKPSAVFENLLVENNVTSKYIENSNLTVIRNNSSIDTINEGLIEALFIPPFELALKGDAKDEFAFTKTISGFNTNSFEMTFEFLTRKKEQQNLLALGVYTKYSEIDLSIVNDDLVFKTKNMKSTIASVNSAKIKGKWNTCKIVYDKGLLKVYLNDIKTHEVKFKFSEQFYKSKLLTIKNDFVGSIKNLYVYESAK